MLAKAFIASVRVSHSCRILHHTLRHVRVQPCVNFLTRKFYATNAQMQQQEEESDSDFEDPFQELVEQGRLEEASEMIRKSIAEMEELNPQPKRDIAALYSNLGFIYATNDKSPARSFQCFQKSLSYYDRDPVVYDNIGMLFHKNQRYEAATTMYRKALELDNALVPTIHRLANCLQQELKANVSKSQNKEENDQHAQLFEEILQLLNKCIELDPDYLPVYPDLIIELFRSKQEDRKKAEELVNELINREEQAYQEVTNLPPRKGYHLKAFILSKTQRMDEAIKMYEEILANSQDEDLLGESLVNLAPLYELSEKLDNALNTYHKALEYDSNNVDASLGVTRIMDKMGDSLQAEQMLQALLDEHPTKDKVYIALATLMMRDGREEDAKRIIKEAIEKYPVLQASSLPSFIDLIQHKVR
jgi:tetratricopeptide (TPR) repeat protein